MVNSGQDYRAVKRRKSTRPSHSRSHGVGGADALPVGLCPEAPAPFDGGIDSERRLNRSALELSSNFSHFLRFARGLRGSNPPLRVRTSPRHARADARFWGLVAARTGVRATVFDAQPGAWRRGGADAIRHGCGAEPRRLTSVKS